MAISLPTSYTQRLERLSSGNSSKLDLLNQKITMKPIPVNVPVLNGNEAKYVLQAVESHQR